MITPPDYAYGDQDVGDGLIPPNSTLQFDFAVVGVNEGQEEAEETTTEPETEEPKQEEPKPEEPKPKEPKPEDPKPEEPQPEEKPMKGDEPVKRVISETHKNPNYVYRYEDLDYPNEHNRPTGLLDRESGKKKDKEPQPTQQEQSNDNEENKPTGPVDEEKEQDLETPAPEQSHEEDMEPENTQPENTQPLIKLQIRQDGKGEYAKNGDKVYLWYTGKLTNGDVFESNMEDRYPLSFTIGDEDAIQAWNEAFIGLQRGTQARIITPPEYGFGDQDIQGIPPNSTLIFDVIIAGIKPGSML